MAHNKKKSKKEVSDTIGSSMHGIQKNKTKDPVSPVPKEQAQKQAVSTAYNLTKKKK